MKTACITITEKQLELINKLCKETGLTKSDIFRRILDEYFEKIEKNKK